MKRVDARAGALLTCCALLYAAASFAEPQTVVLRGNVAFVGNSKFISGEGEFGEFAVDPTLIPFALGDEVRVLLTYDTSALGTLNSPCNPEPANGNTPGTGYYYFVDGIQEGTMTLGGTAGSVGHIPYDGQPHSSRYVNLMDCDGNRSGDGYPPTNTVTFNTNLDGPAIGDVPMVSATIDLRAGADCVGGAQPPTVTELLSSECEPIFIGGEPDTPYFQIFWGVQVSTPNGPLNRYVWASGVGTFSEATNEDLGDQIIAEVLVLNLNAGLQNSLDGKIEAAVEASDSITLATYATTETQRKAAKANAQLRIRSFISQVEAQRGKAISSEAADRLVRLATQLAVRL